MLKSASDGKLQDVRTCLEKGADINYRDEVRTVRKEIVVLHLTREQLKKERTNSCQGQCCEMI